MSEIVGDNSTRETQPAITRRIGDFLKRRFDWIKPRITISKTLAFLAIVAGVYYALARAPEVAPISAPLPDSDADNASLLIAPFLHGQYFCDEAVALNTVHTEEEAALFSASIGKNAANRISATLDSLGPKVSPSGKYQLGYTLNVPLMRYFRKIEGRWVLDTDALKANLGTITDVDRPVVVYLSINHFTDANVELSAELARDTRNLMWNRSGPMHPDDYFNNPIIAWTLSDQGAPINVMRRHVFSAAVDVISKLPANAQKRIAAVSVLGETHDLFPRLVGGPSFDIDPYNATDYSPVSVQGFRTWLMQKYSTIAALNRDLAADFTSFAAINPPSKDIRRETLIILCEHVNIYYSGQIPIYGWIHDKRGRSLKVDVYLNGAGVGPHAPGLAAPTLPMLCQQSPTPTSDSD
jgi:hypothetical protein